MEKITLNVGNSVTLKFKSLATAGYMWDFEIDRSGVVSIVSEGISNAINLAAGQSLDEVFDIAASSPGVVQLTFRQRRSWQRDNPVAVKEYSVEVK